MDNDFISTIEKLKYRLKTYSTSEVYLKNNYPKSIVAAINIAICLVELSIFDNRNITNEEQRWFEGQTQIAKLFDNPEWEDISQLYDKLVSKAAIHFT
jgi:hypothetical protein